MPVIVKKKESSRQEKNLNALTDSDSLKGENLLKVIKESYSCAKKAQPNYEDLKEELKNYDLDLPEQFDIPDLAKMNALYAIGQKYHSRVSTIEMVAIDNHNNWESLVNDITSYIEEKRCEILVSEEVKNLKNSIQEATIRTKLKTLYSKLNVIKNKEQEAASFKQIVNVKKKDLTSILMNLTRQVKTLSLEMSTNH